MSRPNPDRIDTSVVGSVHDVGENRLNNLVVQADRGTMFHRHEWLAAIEEGLDCDPRHAVVRKDTNPVAILPTFAVPLEPPTTPPSRSPPPWTSGCSPPAARGRAAR